jgi:hypothetical protein
VASCKTLFNKFKDSSCGSEVPLQTRFQNEIFLYSSKCSFQEPMYQSLEIFLSRVLDWVSLLTNKKRYSEVYNNYGNKVLRGVSNVRVILMSYGMHEFLLRVFNCKCKWTW